MPPLVVPSVWCPLLLGTTSNKLPFQWQVSSDLLASHTGVTLSHGDLGCSLVRGTAAAPLTILPQDTEEAENKAWVCIPLHWQ